VDVRLILYERLRPISVVNVPVDDQNPPQAVLLASVVGAMATLPKRRIPSRGYGPRGGPEAVPRKSCEN